MGGLLKFVEIGLPTLAFHVLDGKSYLDFLFLRLRNTERQDDEEERSSGEKTRRHPHDSAPQVAALRANESMSPQHPGGDDGSSANQGQFTFVTRVYMAG